MYFCALYDIQYSTAVKMYLGSLYRSTSPGPNLYYCSYPDCSLCSHCPCSGLMLDRSLLFPPAPHPAPTCIPDIQNINKRHPFPRHLYLCMISQCSCRSFCLIPDLVCYFFSLFLCIFAVQFSVGYACIFVFYLNLLLNLQDILMQFMQNVRVLQMLWIHCCIFYQVFELAVASRNMEISPPPPHPLPGDIRGCHFQEDKTIKKRKRKRRGNSKKNERKMKNIISKWGKLQTKQLSNTCNTQWHCSQEGNTYIYCIFHNSLVSRFRIRRFKLGSWVGAVGVDNQDRELNSLFSLEVPFNCPTLGGVGLN